MEDILPRGAPKPPVTQDNNTNKIGSALAVTAAVQTIPGIIDANNSSPSQTFNIVFMFIIAVILCLVLYKTYEWAFPPKKPILTVTDDPNIIPQKNKINDNFKNTASNISDEELEKMAKYSTDTNLEKRLDDARRNAQPPKSADESKLSTIIEGSSVQNTTAKSQTPQPPSTPVIKLTKGSIVVYDREDIDNKIPLKVYNNIKEILSEKPEANNVDLENAIKNGAFYLDHKYVRVD
jgi:hypothetical protein